MGWQMLSPDTKVEEVRKCLCVRDLVVDGSEGDGEYGAAGQHGHLVPGGGGRQTEVGEVI